MKIVLFFVSLLLLSAPTLIAQESDEQLFRRAEELFTATLYQEAIPLYSSVNSPSLQPAASCRIGEAFFYLGQYEKALHVFNSIPNDSLPTQGCEDKVFLVAVCHRHLGNYNDVLATLSEISLSKYRDEAAFEQGMAHYFLNHPEDARRYFNLLANSFEKPDLQTLSRFYLARIALAEKQPHKAESLLNGVKNPESTALLHELAFLKGEVAFAQSNYPKAIDFFSIALPSGEYPSSPWIEEGLYKQGLSYLKLAEDPKESASEQKLSIDKAVKTFSALMIMSANERHVLALAHAHLVRADRINDPRDRERAEQLLENFDGYLSPETKSQALLMRKQAQDSRSVASIREKAQAEWGKGTLESKIQALDTLESTFQDELHPEEFDELYREYALLIVNESIPEKPLKRIEAVLKLRNAQKPSPSSQFGLAAFYFKCGLYRESLNVYLEFIEKNPTSSLLPEALIKASFSLEASLGNSEDVKKLRRRIYENYPLSEMAPLAYFLSYTYQEYLQGNREAVKHLENFKNEFPNSPLLITVNYLIGLDLKRDRRTPEGKWVRKQSPAQSIQAFSDVESTFDRLESMGKIPVEESDYYLQLRYRAILERALVHYNVAEESNAAKQEIYFQYAMTALLQLEKILKLKEHPLTIALAKEKPFPSLYEENLYWLARSQLGLGDEKAAIQTLENMLDNYRNASIKHSYYLAKASYELGILFFQKENYTQALAFFIKADEASKSKFLGVDEKLDVWIYQSRCYTALDQLEESMLALSKVINDDSASHLRLKAMLMRADLYERLGRPELARRQLEAISKMNGEWAEQAKTKLERDYANI